MTRFIQLSIIFIILQSCGYYSFTGKSIPPQVKTVQLLLFEDNSGRYDLSLPQELFDKIEYYIDDYRLMDIDDSKDADSKIYGRIRSFTEVVASQNDDEIAEQRKLTMTLSINFYDNINSDFIIKEHPVSYVEYYDETGGDEARDEAFKELIDRISEETVIALSSNW